MPRFHRTIIRDLATAVLFFAVILAPTVGMLVSPKRRPASSEKRRLQAAPAFGRLFKAPHTFLRDLRGYLSDHFAFRRELIVLHNYLLYHLFDRSTVERVTVGKQEWLFYSPSVETYRTHRHYSRRTLDIKTRTLAERAAWSRRHGIQYLFVPAPSKPSIYPEMLPPHVRRVLRPSRLRQLLEELERRGQVPFVDLERVFLAQKPRQRLYHRTDTHWNDQGAFLAYQAIIAALAEKVPIPLLPNYAVRRRTEWYRGGDLSVMLSLQDYVAERAVRLERLGGFRALSVPAGISGYRHAARFNSGTSPAPRLLLLGDSFAFNTRFARFLAERFSESLVIRTDNDLFDVDLVKRFRPEVIVQERVERHLEGSFERNPAALR